MDISILAWLSEHRLPALDAIFTSITFIGSETAVIAMICLIYWCMNKRLGNRLLLSLFTGMLVNQFLKVTFCVRRPYVRSERVKPIASTLSDAGDYSFPSGHTANSTALFGMLGSEKNKWFRLFWIVPVLIGFSRLYVGVHTPQDVLVSLALGVGFVFLSRYIEKKLHASPKLDLPIAALCVLLSIALAIYTALKPYPDENGLKMSLECIKLCGAAVGIFVGWPVERRAVRFSVCVPLWKKALRLVLGVGLLLLIMNALKSPLNLALGQIIGSFVRYMLVGLCATLFWPCVFTRLGF